MRCVVEKLCSPNVSKSTDKRECGILFKRVILIFPNETLAMMLSGAYLQKLSEERIPGRRYMDMTEALKAKVKVERKEKASDKQQVSIAQSEVVAVNM